MTAFDVLGRLGQQSSSRLLKNPVVSMLYLCPAYFFFLYDSIRKAVFRGFYLFEFLYRLLLFRSLGCARYIFLLVLLVNCLFEYILKCNLFL